MNNETYHFMPPKRAELVNNTKIVEEGCDNIAHAYYEKRDKFSSINRLREFYNHLPPDAKALDGCPSPWGVLKNYARQM